MTTFADHWRTKALEAERQAREIASRLVQAECRLSIAITLAAQTMLNQRDHPDQLDALPIVDDPIASGHALSKIIADEIRAVGDPDAEWVMAMIIKRTAELYLKEGHDAPEPPA